MTPCLRIHLQNTQTSLNGRLSLIRYLRIGRSLEMGYGRSPQSSRLFRYFSVAMADLWNSSFKYSPENPQVTPLERSN